MRDGRVLVCIYSQRTHVVSAALRSASAAACSATCAASCGSARPAFNSATWVFAFSAFMRASNAATCALTFAGAAAAGFAPATAVATVPVVVSSRIFFA